MKKLCLSAMLIIGLCVLTTGCYEISSGERYGTLTRFSKQGILFKTYEGELILEAFGASGSSNTFYFSAEDGKIINELNSNVGKQVKLQYKEELIAAPWRGKTDTFIKKIN